MNERMYVGVDLERFLADLVGLRAAQDLVGDVGAADLVGARRNAGLQVGDLVFTVRHGVDGRDVMGRLGLGGGQGLRLRREFDGGGGRGPRRRRRRDVSRA